ncbi:hypothetical protein ACP6NG_08990 [Brevibacterium casei]
MSSEPYVPSEEEMREYVVVGGEYRPWAPPGDGTETRYSDNERTD